MAPIPEPAKCARTECSSPRSPDRQDVYCSALCSTISHVTHAGPLPTPPEWSWARDGSGRR